MAVTVACRDILRPFVSHEEHLRWVLLIIEQVLDFVEPQLVKICLVLFLIFVWVAVYNMCHRFMVIILVLVVLIILIILFRFFHALNIGRKGASKASDNQPIG